MRRLLFGLLLVLIALPPRRRPGALHRPHRSEQHILPLAPHLRPPHHLRI